MFCILIHLSFLRNEFYYGFILFAILLMIVIIIHYYITKYKIARSIKIEQIRSTERERLREQMVQYYHDQLGNKLTKIVLYTEILKRSLPKSKGKIPAYLDILTETCNSLCQDSIDFIWALNPENENLAKVGEYLKHYAESLMKGQEISLKIHSPAKDLHLIMVNMEWKRQLIMIFKDCIGYVYSHLHCDKATLEFSHENTSIVIGLAFHNPRCSTADEISTFVELMKKRAQILHGEIEWIQKNGGESRILFKGTLPQT